MVDCRRLWESSEQQNQGVVSVDASIGVRRGTGFALKVGATGDRRSNQ
jgi:hypothetical protein